MRRILDWGGLRGTVLFVWIVATLWFYGWLRIVLLVALVAVGIFFGTMFFYALYDAIRTRNDRDTPARTPPDDELKRLRAMAGLEK